MTTPRMQNFETIRRFQKCLSRVFKPHTLFCGRFVATVFFSATLISASGTTLVFAPNENAAVEGNARTVVPFLINAAQGDPSGRFQQIYEASEFLAFPEGVLIQEMDFRIDSDYLKQGFAATLPNIQLEFSTTTKDSDSLSPVFSENIGHDHQVVLNGLVKISGDFSASMRPQKFDVRFVFSQPFIYRPGSGNLLLDVKNFSGTLIPGGLFGYPALNATLQSPSVASIYAGSVSANSGQAAGALVTQFRVTPVPEPSELAFASFAVGIFQLMRRKHNRSSGRVPIEIDKQRRRDAAGIRP
jgi:hypothetical protein